MLYIFMGPSCSGKSSAAEELKKLINVQIYTGKDYLRIVKNEYEAWEIFNEKLKEASNNKDLNSQSIVYIISEKNDVSKIQSLENAVTIKFTASLEIIKSRFSKRMKGNIPKPVEKMIERQLMDWKNIDVKLFVDTSVEEPDEVAKKVYDFALKICE
ncbi:MAG: hypothetical protein ACREV6_19770 [Clostridium sp.]|uniref:hypothetical protein n=1 Tax=Clostridium sp. TaxID=1506 RepID=UPI003D6C8356